MVNMNKENELFVINEPTESETSVAVGIDLGTTYSLIAYSHDGKVDLLADESDCVKTASVIAVTKAQERFVGNEATPMRGKPGTTVVSSIKRLMGKQNTLSIHGKHITPVEVSTEILKHLKLIAQTRLNCSNIDAVVTVPAYFDEAQRQATKQAAAAAGLNVLRIINEPTAAALAYGLDRGMDGIYAVYDLGGGTFDVSILKMKSGVFKVLAIGGDTHLGGDDIDILLARHLGLEDDEAYHACSIKEQLSSMQMVEVCVGDRVVNVSRDELNVLIKPLIKKTMSIMRTTIKDAGIDPKEIDGVVLVGGSTRIPLIKEMLRSVIHPDTKIYDDANPDEIVAIGAAIQAESLVKGSSHLLLDVIPLSLGIELLGGINDKLIHRNTTIPAAAHREFTTHVDGQTGIKFHIVQGERDMASDCRSLARFEITGIPPQKAGQARVGVSFIIDADGLLTVEAMELSTGAKQTVIVEARGGLNQQEIEQELLKDANTMLLTK